MNPDNVGTCEGSVRNSDSFALWHRGPPVFLQGFLEPKPISPAVVVCSVSIDVDPSSLKSNTCLDQMIESAPNLYALKKRAACLIALTQYIVAKLQKRSLGKTNLNVGYLPNAFMNAVKLVQKNPFRGSS